MNLKLPFSIFMQHNTGMSTTPKFCFILPAFLVVSLSLISLSHIPAAVYADNDPATTHGGTTNIYNETIESHSTNITNKTTNLIVNVIIVNPSQDFHCAIIQNSENDATADDDDDNRDKDNPDHAGPHAFDVQCESKLDNSADDS